MKLAELEELFKPEKKKEEKIQDTFIHWDDLFRINPYRNWLYIQDYNEIPRRQSMPARHSEANPVIQRRIEEILNRHYTGISINRFVSDFHYFERLIQQDLSVTFSRVSCRIRQPAPQDTSVYLEIEYFWIDQTVRFVMPLQLYA